MRIRKALIGMVMLAGVVLARPLVAKADTATTTVEWKADAHRVGLSDQAIAILGKQKFVVAGPAVRQVFSAYKGATPLLPPIITSDAMITGYHSLFERSLIQLEVMQARKLPAALRTLADNLKAVGAGFKGDAGLEAAALKRAQIIVGIARVLSGDGVKFEDPAVAQIVQDEVKKVLAAKGTSMPKWLGQPDRTFLAIDYSRFKTRGFYTARPELEQYFRAVGWLSAIPFRPERDEELVSMAMLIAAAHYKPDRQENASPVSIIDFTKPYRDLLGPPSSADLKTESWTSNVSEVSIDAAGLVELRDRLVKAASRKGFDRDSATDQLRAPQDEEAPPPPRFRIWSPHRISDGALLLATTDPAKFGVEGGPPARPLPSGLDVAAANGSALAKKRLPQQHQALVGEITEAAEFRTRPRSDRTLYDEYLVSLATLLDEPEKDAPPFMASEAWRTKQLNGFLAGWSQQRHAWALHVEESLSVFGADRKREHPRFVEPVPEFFGHLAKTIRRTEDRLSRFGAIKADATEAVEITRQAIASLAQANLQEKGAKRVVSLSPALVRWAKRNAASRAAEGHVVTDDDIVNAAIELTPELQNILRLIELGDPDGVSLAIRAFDLPKDLTPEWERLHDLCRQLESLAHKQLRHVPFTDEQNAFIDYFGEELASIMGYHAEAAMNPRDDAPQTIDVFHNPRTGQFLQTATGRPMPLYVLYPWKGEEVLCRGVIVPYYEFTSPARLNDAEWQLRLDQPERPSVPEWAKLMYGDPKAAREKRSNPKPKPE